MTTGGAPGQPQARSVATSGGRPGASSVGRRVRRRVEQREDPGRRGARPLHLDRGGGQERRRLERRERREHDDGELDGRQQPGADGRDAGEQGRQHRQPDGELAEPGGDRGRTGPGVGGGGEPRGRTSRSAASSASARPPTRSGPASSSRPSAVAVMSARLCSARCSVLARGAGGDRGRDDARPARGTPPSARPAGGQNAHIASTVPAPSAAATPAGSSPRTTTSPTASTSAPTRASRSPRRSRRSVSGRRDREPLVQGGAQLGHAAQGDVVGHQPLEVAQHPAADAERAHRDGRDRQLEHRRHLRGARDQPGRHRGQRDRAAERERPEQEGEREPARVEVEEPDRAAQRARGSCEHLARSDRTCTTSSATATSDGRCATSSTVRPASRSARTVSRTTCSPAASRWAVGSSRTTSGVVARAGCGSARRAGAGPGSVPRRRGRAGWPSRRAGSRATASRPVSAAAVAREPSSPPTSSADRARLEHGPLRQPRHLAHSEAGSTSARSTPSIDARPVVGAQQPERDLERRGLADAARTRQRDDRARPQHQVEAVRRAAARGPDRHAVEPQGRRPQVRRRPCPGRRDRRLQHLERPPRRRDPVGRRVELDPDLAQRQEDLGRQDEDRDPGDQVEVRPPPAAARCRPRRAPPTAW